MDYHIGESCVRCQYCKAECPEGAIGLKGTRYAINAEKCVNCGLCAQACPVSAISGPEDSAPVEKHPLRELSCDLLVIGAGGSGLVAAVKAAQQTGKKVIVLEKAKKVGGCANFAHGFVLNYSKWHERAGLEDIRPEQIRRAIERNPGINTGLLREIIYGQADFFDWLCSLGGADDAFDITEKPLPPEDLIRLVEKTIGFPEHKLANLKSEDPSIGPGWMGTYVIEKMMEYCERLGVGVLTRHSARELITDFGGRVTGVIADDPGGSTRISCKACLIASGCFSYNDELIKKVCPEFFDAEIIRRAAPTCTGDGIAIAEKIGAKIDYDSIRVDILPPPDHTFGHAAFCMLNTPEPVVVSLDGRRYFREDKRAENCFIKQRQGIVYGIMDEVMLDNLSKTSMENPFDESDRPILEKYRETLEENLLNDVALKRGDTLLELGLELNRAWGTDPAEFVEEIERYNLFCENGCDEDFGKDPKFLIPLKTPPYYAFYGQGFSEGTYGGIVTDAQMRVLGVNGAPIPGLYAAGDTARGFGNKNYDDSPVSTFTWAVCSGYIAGIRAAEALAE